MTVRRLVLPLLLAAACAGLVVAAVRESRRAAEVGEGPERAGGRVERCLVCHDDPDESPGGAHAADALGCEACHLGNRLAYDKRRAHAGLEREPGALDTVDRTCGRSGCHVREVERVTRSLMATGRGLIAVDRWVFGEAPGPDGTETFRELLAVARPSPAQDHLRRLCAGCHLGTRGENRDDAVSGVGSGCASCHAARRAPGTAGRHEPIDARVPDERCRGGHSRSGRVSLSYAGLVELRPGDPAATTRLYDGRPAAAAEPDVHGEQGMSCVDCHTIPDVMGDGRSYAHEEAQAEATCEGCHPPAAAADGAPWGAAGDALVRDLLRLRGEARGPLEPARWTRRGVPLWNVRPAHAFAGGDGEAAEAPWALAGKLDGRLHPLRPTPADADHGLRGHERLACVSCHAAWAPSCATCHTRFDAAGRQWDFGRGAEVSGAWVEESERFGWGPPALAVLGDRIVPAMPGMILTVDAAGTGRAALERRLFAALDPHATRRESRSCASCHAEPVALGLGSGTLDLGPGGPRFEPAEPAAGEAGVAADGWVALFPSRPGEGTRAGLRSLDAAEQRRVVRVGTCVPCHGESSDAIYGDFGGAVGALFAGGSACTFRAPEWVRGTAER
ncbi:MAG: hypothetical protein HY905_13495 [Deltaproteobacteria bacterium]|nr:hypothetical protein [Deltaproteobacteria bacterium]